MKLNIFERLVILNNLPKGGSIAEAIVLPMIHEKVGIKDDEARRIKMKIDERSGAPVWDVKKDKGIDVHFGKLERSVLKKHYEGLSNAGQLPIANPQIIDLYCKLTGASIDAIKADAIEDNVDDVPPENLKKAKK